MNTILRRTALICLCLLAAAGCDRQTPSTPAPNQPAGGNGSQPAPAVDPPKSVGPPDELFAGWPQPQVALVITGNQHGYLEPCGCTGLANQKGGLARRHALIQQLAGKGWKVVPLDAGNQVRRIGRQAEIQFHLTADALSKMDYRAAGVGPDDLQLSSGEIFSAVASDDGSKPFLSANVAVLDRSLMPRHTVVATGGRKIGVTAVLGQAHHERAGGGDVELEPVEAGLAEVLPKFDEAECDYRILLAFASAEDAAEIARKHKVFDLVVSAGSGEPTYEPEKIDGTKSQLVQTGVKGMYVCVVGLYDDPRTPVRYQRVPLDARWPDSPEMLGLLADYQQQLKEAGFEGLGIKALPHPSGRTFVGSATCGECHTQAMAVWEKTPHAHATDSLIHPSERGDIQRHYDPECLSCHVTGWEPQRYFPFASGYLSVEKTKAMLHNGCENCHGPGSDHVAAENGDARFTPERVRQLRDEMRLPLADKVAERKCMECHDLDNSPDFHDPGAFERYWEKVKHVGKE